MLDRVKEAMEHAFGNYKQFAWGQDNLKPISKSSSNTFLGMGATLVDSLDTLSIMGLDDFLADAEHWIETSLKFGDQKDVNVFETTIRVLGGLLTAHEMSGKPIYLSRAKEVADALSVAFSTSPSGIPFGTVDLRTGRAFNPPWSGSSSSMAEVATLQLEWEALSRLTGDPKYAAMTRAAMLKLKAVMPEDGLFPMFVTPSTGRLYGSQVTLGARGDSLYEYLLKQWVYAGGLSNPSLDHLSAEVGPGHTVSDREYFQTMLDMFDQSVEGIEKQLLLRSSPSNWLYVAERYGGKIKHKMDHLVCFFPGVLALSSLRPSTPTFNASHHLYLAKELTATCNQFYHLVPSGLAPEIVLFPDGSDPVVDPGAKHSLLRPETVESIMVMYRVTGDEKYRDMGRTIFSSFVQAARVAHGFSSIRDVTKFNLPREDNMESFFLAETLKYLYMLFSDSDVLPLDKFVANTEAHFLRIPSRHKGQP